MDNITPRQTEVWRLMAYGMTNRQIARELEITPATVKTHIYTLFKRIGALNRTEAAVWYRTGRRDVI